MIDLLQMNVGCLYEILMNDQWMDTFLSYPDGLIQL